MGERYWRKAQVSLALAEDYLRNDVSLHFVAAAVNGGFAHVEIT